MAQSDGRSTDSIRERVRRRTSERRKRIEELLLEIKEREAEIERLLAEHYE